MKLIVIAFGIALMVGCNNISDKKESKTSKTESCADSAASARMFEDATTPGPIQKMLAAYAGKWSEDHTFWQDENSPGDKNVLVIENEMIVGGRYLQIRETGILAGKPFEGIGMLGYDNLRKTFVSTWQDNVMTGILYFEGNYDSTTKIITLKGQYTDLAKGKVDLKQTFRLIDYKHYENNWYGTKPGGKEMKFTEKKMTRK